MFLAAAYFFSYVGAEITFGGWIYSYAVMLGLAGVSGAAYLNSGFWFAFAVGRLVSIALAARMTLVRLIVSALEGGLFFLALVAVLPGSAGVLWAAAIGAGFCMGPVYASGLALVGQSMHLTARRAGLVLMGDSVGGMLLPWLVGGIIERTGPWAMIYLVFSSLTGAMLAFFAMLRVRSAGSSIPRTE
jgi:MFS transporter, FHS family, Na+ dependent glucose transporter 1